MNDTDILIIPILFQSGGFHCLKHYYKEYVYKHLEYLFPRQLSYNRFVELEKEVLLPWLFSSRKYCWVPVQFVTKVKNNMKNSLTGMADKTLFRKRALIETVNDELKNITQIEYSRHRLSSNFIANSLSDIAAYCFFEKKPVIDVNFVNDGHLLFFDFILNSH